MSGIFLYLFLIGHDTKYLEKWLVLIVDVNPLGALPPRVFVSNIRTSHFMNITYLTFETI